MYKIIGADQREYGPVSAEQVLLWIRERRANGQTQARPVDSTDWRPLSSFPEFAVALSEAGVPPVFSAGAAPALPPLEEVLGSDYTLDIGNCFSGAWNVLKEKFGVIFGGVLIYMGIVLAIVLFGMIPIIGILFSLANVVVAGPLEGGLFYLVLRCIRGEPAAPGDVLAGFRSGFVQLFLAKLVTGLLAALCMLPAVVASIILVLPHVVHKEPVPPGTALLMIVIALICMIPAMLLQVNWIFALPLIIDRQLTFWPAMQASWKMVLRHWWQVFALVVLVGLMNVGGLLLCCAGMLFTVPLGVAALMYAYETIFSRSGPRAS
ncbi:MAG: glycerophosphoryl diester phosphodiesterase membrane domain-containing protein [Verrucomicrobiota bacterium]